MKKREVYLINNNHGIIIIIDNKHYLYIKNSNESLLTEKNVEKIVESRIGSFKKDDLRKISKLNMKNVNCYIGQLDDEVFSSLLSSIYPNPENCKFQRYDKFEMQSMIYSATQHEIDKLRNYLEEYGVLTATDEELENAWVKFSNERLFTNWGNLDSYNMKRFLQCCTKYIVNSSNTKEKNISKTFEFEWYIFVNNNIIAGFNDNAIALDFFKTMPDGAILQNRCWLKKDN